MNGRLVLRLCAAVASMSGALAGWLTWTVSGSATRNSYASLRAAQRLGIEQLTPFRVVWFCVPVAVLAVVVLVAVRADLGAALIGVLTAIVLVAFGGVVLLTPLAGGVGPWLSVGAGLALLVASVGLLAQGRSEA